MVWFCVILTLLLISSLLWTYLRVLRPLRALTRDAADVASGQLNALSETETGVPEVRELRRAMRAMAGHVQRAQAQQLDYAQRLTAGQEAERARIARELHDDTTQVLIAIAHSIDMSRGWLESQPDRAADSLRTARQQAVAAVESLRGLIADLRPPALEELGLIPALRIHTSQLSPLAVQLQVEGTTRRLPEAHELVLFRCAQEALSNARRHGRAAQAVVTVHYHDDFVELRVRDDGTGFQPPPALTSLSEAGHYGLLGVQERVNRLQGDMQLTSSPGAGTTLTIRLPEAAVRPANHVRDPVCGALIVPAEAYGHVDYRDATYFFCCPVCQGAFQRDPEAYLVSTSSI